MKYKKRIAIVSLLLLLVVSFSPVYALSHQFHELSMTVELQEDGSAIIQETWDMTVAKGTENYKVFDNMGEATITDFSVVDESNEYQYLEYWNVNASKEEKQNKCGVVKNGDHYELCYGVGTYGRHQYTMKYTVHKFIDQYKDSQAINFQLVSKGMDTMPEKVSVMVRGSMITSNVKIYGFGYIGSVTFQELGQDGSTGIFLTNVKDNGELGSVNYVNLLAGFTNGTFSDGNPQYSHNTFDEIVSDAKKGSDYGEEMDSALFLCIIGGIFALCIIIPLLGVWHMSYRRKHYFPKNLLFSDGNHQLPKKTEVQPFRDIPCQKDIFNFYYVALKADLMDKKDARSGIISAILLSWIRDGKIDFVKGKDGFFNRNTYEIDFNKEIDCENRSEFELAQFFKEASGENGILEAKEFEKWCKKNYTKIDAWFINVKMYIENGLEADGRIQRQTLKSSFLGIRSQSVKIVYTPAFREELLHVAGFKNFLLEFSNIQEKQVMEVKLWEEYLIFASILGIAEKVEKELGRLYPEFNEQSRIDVSYTTIATRAFIYSGMRNSTAARNAAQMRDSGGGGFSSFGGGGGSFHGGGGGGTR